MTGYQLGVLAYLAGVLSFFAGGTVDLVVTASARRRSDPADIAAILGAARPAALLLRTGVVLILLGGFYLASKIDGFGQGWLLVSIALFALALFVGAWGDRRIRACTRYARELAEHGRGEEAVLSGMLRDRFTAALHWGALGLATVVLVVMVLKPGR